MPKQKRCWYYDTPENDELVGETAEQLNMNKSKFIRLAIDALVNKYNRSGVMRRQRRGHETSDA